MRTVILTVLAGLVAMPAIAAPIEWRTDYTTAYEEAEQDEKILLLVFESDSFQFTPNEELQTLLRDVVAVRLQVEEWQTLLSHPGLRHFHCDAGVGVIDLKNKGSKYGRVVNVLPVTYLTQEGVAAMVRMAQDETDLPELSWHGNYHEARAEAEREHKMLLIAIDSDEQRFEPKPRSIPALHGYVRLRQTTATTYADEDEDEPKPLIRFADFKQLRAKPGLVVYDFRNEEDPQYGDVVSVMPYKYIGPNPGNRVFSEEEREHALLILEPNSLSQRTLTWAIRVSKGYGDNTRLRSADGRPCSKLMSWALKNSRLQCSYGCGHHAGGPMRSEIASPGSGKDLVDGALNMIGTLRTIYDAKSSAVTDMSVKIAIGPMKNGIHQTPGT